MSDYQAPLKHMQFVINELAMLDKISSLPGYEDATAEMVEAILEQAAVLAGEVLSPINFSGDEAGTHIKDGVVVSPEGFTDAYRQFIENGWQGKPAVKISWLGISSGGILVMSPSGISPKFSR